MVVFSPEGVVAPAVMAEALRGFTSKLRRRLRAQADAADLTPSQVAVLRRLEREGSRTASALARAEGMRAQSMGAIISTLQAAGLVVGEPDPGDGRQTLLALSDRCRDELKAGRAARQDWLAATLQERLTLQEQQRLAAVLPLLRRLVDD